MKRLMIITTVFALLLTGCGTRVSHDTLIELSVSSITEYQNRLNAIHPKDLQVSINELAQKEGLELVLLLLNTAERSINTQEPILMTGLNIQFQRQTTGTSFGFL